MTSGLFKNRREWYRMNADGTDPDDRDTKPRTAEEHANGWYLHDTGLDLDSTDLDTLTAVIREAMAQARREGAAEMRERVADFLGNWETPGWCAQNAIRALPLEEET